VLDGEQVGPEFAQGVEHTGPANRSGGIARPQCGERIPSRAIHRAAPFSLVELIISIITNRLSGET
jgi:hypothetical protein